MSNQKQRLDILMLERALASTRNKAHAHIIAGDVFVDGVRVDKPGTRVASEAEITVKEKSFPYVSRGGIKLAHALKRWPCDLKDAVCIDVGASTGGFTDVLLRAGAKQVFAVDVGTNQLDWKLRSDPRVICLEKTHILHVPVGTFVPAPTIATVDVSFISLRLVLPKLLPHLVPQARLYILVKPQFEVGREAVGKGGIIRDAVLRESALASIVVAAEQLGLQVIGHCESPITGTRGNVEYLLVLRR